MVERLKNPAFLGVLAFSIIGTVLVVMILKWVYINLYLNNVITGVKEKEVVGVQIQSPKETDEPQYPFAEVDFTDLLKRNDETVGWLKVGAINLDIPIVQTSNNEFYLNHDIDKKPNDLGWVFADVRSNTEFLGVNTVLYGHNAASKQMFGSLKNLYNIDPDRVAVDGIIQFTTPHSQMVFELVSVYVTEYDDWMYVDQVFTNDEEKIEFMNRMVAKNEISALKNSNLSVHDKFLTFSTCYGPSGTTKRLVVHAKLVAEK